MAALEAQAHKPHLPLFLEHSLSRLPPGPASYLLAALRGVTGAVSLVLDPTLELAPADLAGVGDRLDDVTD